MTYDHAVYMRDYYRRLSPEKKEKVKARMRAYNRANRSRAKERRLWREFGITQAQFDAMFEAQGGRCPICLTTDWGHYGVPVVDHDHKTGKVRGLLCQDCNKALGLMRDQASSISRMLSYLGSI